MSRIKRKKRKFVAGDIIQIKEIPSTISMPRSIISGNVLEVLGVDRSGSGVYVQFLAPGHTTLPTEWINIRRQLGHCRFRRLPPHLASNETA